MIEQVSKIIGQDVYFMAQYGSVNYNTTHPDSDIDWRGYVRYHDDDNKILKIDNNDITIGGLNQFKYMVGTMESKAIEVFFSQKIEINQNLPPYIQEVIQSLLDMKHQVAAMDTSSMFREYLKGYEERMILSTLHPYDTVKMEYLKHAYRLLNTLERFHKTDFQNYRYAIQLKSTDLEKYFIDSMNTKQISLEDATNKIKYYYKTVLTLENDFNRMVDKTTLFKFNELIEEIGGDIYGLWCLRR